MITCKICNSPVTMPMKLNCGHIFCFLCLKGVMFHSGSKCPQCNIFIAEDLNNVKVDDLYKFTVEHRKYFWLYSSNYANHWWCYNSDLNDQIERIYSDYESRKNIQTEINNNIGENNNKNDDDIQISVTPKIGKFDLDNKDDQDNKDNMNFKIDLSLDPIKDVPKSKVNLIDFTDLDNLDLSTSSEESEDEDEKSPPLSYIIKICGSEYKIDFDQMKQISVINSNKKRNIKRIEVDGRIENIEKYLKTNYSVLGMGGVKF